MAYAPASPITGATVTGLTTPTYTIAADQNPAMNGKQWYVSALGGTQTGVSTHTGSCPFTVSVFRVVNFNKAPVLAPNGGFRTTVPKNRFSRIYRKGMLPLAGQPYEVAMRRESWDIPAGSDTADAASIKALVSMSSGESWASADQWATTLLTNTI